MIPLCDVLEEVKLTYVQNIRIVIAYWGLTEKRHERTCEGDAVFCPTSRGCIHLSKFIELYNLRLVPFTYVHSKMLEGNVKVIVNMLDC